MRRRGRPGWATPSLTLVVRSERPGAVRGPEAGRTVPAGSGVAPLRRGAGAVAAAGDVEQARGVLVGGGVAVAATRQRVHRRDDRRGLAGAAELRPRGVLRRG